MNGINASRDPVREGRQEKSSVKVVDWNVELAMTALSLCVSNKAIEATAWLLRHSKL